MVSDCVRWPFDGPFRWHLMASDCLPHQVTVVGVGSPPVLVDERRLGHRRSAGHDGRSRRGSRSGGDDAEDEDEDEVEGGEGEEEGEGEVKGAEGADARDEGIPGEGRGTMPTRRYLLVVNDCDVVPRKLRSQMAL